MQALCLVAYSTLLVTTVSSFIRSGINCEDRVAVGFGYNVYTSCLFPASNCTIIRAKIQDIIIEATKDIEKLDDGTGKKVPLIANTSHDDDQEENSTDCTIAVSVQLKILYNPITSLSSRYLIVGKLLSIDKAPTLETQPVKFGWTVLFREVKPKSDKSRWWEHMTSNEGSSYSIFWMFDGFTTEEDPSGSCLFSVGLALFVFLLILKPYY